MDTSTQFDGDASSEIEKLIRLIVSKLTANGILVDTSVSAYSDCGNVSTVTQNATTGRTAIATNNLMPVLY